MLRSLLRLHRKGPEISAWRFRSSPDSHLGLLDLISFVSIKVQLMPAYRYASPTILHIWLHRPLVARAIRCDCHSELDQFAFGADHFSNAVYTI